ncbi:predicted protein [Sclerotinia sclerotiorum 1980 UF-70]|uniref:Uncharacterized protein n=1 Tax=Sclerotinia sclerotiorum (strain ATCC 18683 / 1980 / Ss-1) TaxID=665079 RepID=A7E7F2_SCLS1|nr:predicted protein [Sclerotinia sclerotiorum 1980 UF-70]EDN96304.1 predicted protein [Sclerotinia sclerotiorum 1980 UF-70]
MALHKIHCLRRYKRPRIGGGARMQQQQAPAHVKMTLLPSWIMDEASLMGNHLRRLIAILSAGVTSWTSFEALKEPLHGLRENFWELCRITSRAFLGRMLMSPAGHYLPYFDPGDRRGFDIAIFAKCIHHTGTCNQLHRFFELVTMYLLASWFRRFREHQPTDSDVHCGNESRDGVLWLSGPFREDWRHLTNLVQPYSSIHNTTQVVTRLRHSCHFR